MKNMIYLDLVFLAKYLNANIQLLIIFKYNF